jgi:hypothetical protein
MAQQVIASIYGMNYNDWGGTGGYGMTFPAAQVSFMPIPAAVSMGGANMNAIIKVWIASGEPEYFTDKSVSTLLTEANA